MNLGPARKIEIHDHNKTKNEIKKIIKKIKKGHCILFRN